MTSSQLQMSSPVTEIDLPSCQQSFDAFYAAEYPRMVAAAWGVTGRKGVAEELVQEAMFAAYQKWPTIAAMERPGAWVHRSVMNRCLSSLRRTKAEARALFRGFQRSTEEPSGTAGLEAQGVRDAIRTLPRRQAAVVSLHYLAGLSVLEVSTALGIPEGTVKSHLHRGRSELRRALQDSDGA